MKDSSTIVGAKVTAWENHIKYQSKTKYHKFNKQLLSC